MTKQACSNCRFSAERAGDTLMRECHRHAPRPDWAFIHHSAELLRDIAWSQRKLSKTELPAEDDSDDLNKEATEANFYALWPEVEPDDWCGEWAKRRTKQ